MTAHTLSPIVKMVLDEFINITRQDMDIPVASTDRLEKLLLKGEVPTIDEINNAVFSHVEDETE